MTKREREVESGSRATSRRSRNCSCAGAKSTLNAWAPRSLRDPVIPMPSVRSTGSWKETRETQVALLWKARDQGTVHRAMPDVRSRRSEGTRLAGPRGAKPGQEGR